MMAQMQRRSFLAAPLAAWQLKAAETEKRVYATGDGIPHTPAEYAALLASLTGKGEIARDHYSLGGVVEQLESRVAAVLGKETAVWLPTGTLANHLAVRLLAGNRRRVLVQAESHLYERLRRLRRHAQRPAPGAAGARARPRSRWRKWSARRTNLRWDGSPRRSALFKSNRPCGAARASASISSR